MGRWVTAMLMAACAACLYGDDFDPTDEDKVSCGQQDDCDQSESCGGEVISEEHDVGCGSDPYWWLGLDDEKSQTGGGFDYQDAIFFVCVGETRYFPVCAPSNSEFVCDGDPCPDENEIACGVELNNADRRARCIHTGDLGAECGIGEPACEPPTDACVKLFTFDDTNYENRTVCVPPAALL